jgi:hypothetical protein
MDTSNYKSKLLSVKFLLLIFLCYSCSPRIRSFSVTPLIITSKDSVQVNWSVNGKSTLLFHENILPKNSNPLAGDSTLKYFEFTLVAQKHGKERKQMIQVTVLPDRSTNDIIFKTYLKGDTLVASGEKNIQKWGNLFEIITVASGSERALLVFHNGKTVKLNNSTTPSTELAGTPLEGYWEFRSLLTDMEKKDLTKAPETLRIICTIQYKKR